MGHRARVGTIFIAILMGWLLASEDVLAVEAPDLGNAVDSNVPAREESTDSATTADLNVSEQSEQVKVQSESDERSQPAADETTLPAENSGAADAANAAEQAVEPTELPGSVAHADDETVSEQITGTESAPTVADETASNVHESNEPVADVAVETASEVADVSGTVTNTVAEFVSEGTNTEPPVSDTAQNTGTDVVQKTEPVEPAAPEVMATVDPTATQVEHAVAGTPTEITETVTDVDPAREEITEPVHERLSREPILDPIVNETVPEISGSVTERLPPSQPILGPIDGLLSAEPGPEDVPGAVVDTVAGLPSLNDLVAQPIDGVVPDERVQPSVLRDRLTGTISDRSDASKPGVLGIDRLSPVLREPFYAAAGSRGSVGSTTPLSVHESALMTDSARRADTSAATTLRTYEELIWPERALRSTVASTSSDPLPRSALAPFGSVASGLTTFSGSGPSAAILSLLLALVLVSWRTVLIVSIRIPSGILQTIPTPPG